MSRGDFLIGFVLCLAFLGLGAATAYVIAERQLRWMAVGARWVAGALLAATAVALAQLIPLLLGILTRGTAVLTALLLLGGALLWSPAREAPAVDDPEPAPPSGTASRVIAGVAVAVGVVYVVAFLIHNRAVPIGDYDSTSFILPVPARWIQTGSLWHFDDLVPGWGYGAYPQTGSLLQLVALLPWHNDFALRLVNVPFMFMAAGATTALAVELGATVAVGATLAVAAVLIPADAAHALDHAQPDVIMAACFAAAALFLVRYLRTRARWELLLGGIGLGMALGTKWYGGPELVALLAVWAGARLLRRERFGGVALDVVLVGVVALLVGGAWLLRNLVVGGDPLYPGKVALFGVTIFDAPAKTSGSAVDFSVAHYVTHLSILKHYIGSAFKTSFGVAGVLIAVGAVVGLVRGRRRDPRILIVIVAAALVFLVYTVMPYSALGTANHPIFITAGTRYATPAFLLAAAAAAAGLRGLDWRLVAGAQVVAVLALFDAFRRYDTQVGSGTFHLYTKNWLEAAVIVGALAAIWVALRRLRLGRLATAALAIVALLALGAIGRKVEQDFNGKRYLGVNPAFDAIATGGKRLALSGEPDRNYDGAPYIAFGKRLDNRVTFIGTRQKHLLVRYKQPAPFKAALARGGYQLLLLGWDIGGKPPELAWARSAGWQPVASGGTFTLLKPPAVARAGSADVQG